MSLHFRHSRTDQGRTVEGWKRRQEFRFALASCVHALCPGMIRFLELEQPEEHRLKPRQKTASAWDATNCKRRILFLCLLVPCWAQAQAASKPFRLGYFPNITHAQALYARATGEFEKALGVPIEWVSLNAGPSAIEALFVNAIDAAFIGPSPTINGYMKSKGEKFVIVAGAAGGGAGLVVREDSGIETEQDFDGKV